MNWGTVNGVHISKRRRRGTGSKFRPWPEYLPTGGCSDDSGRSTGSARAARAGWARTEKRGDAARPGWQARPVYVTTELGREMHQGCAPYQEAWQKRLKATRPG